MAPNPDLVSLTLQINPGEDYDADELDLMARQLLAEIQMLDVESAELAKSGAAPEGTKGGDAIVLGSLAVSVSPAAAPQVIQLVQSWSTRADNRSVRIQAQSRDRFVQVEYSPAKTSSKVLKGLVDTLTGGLPPESG